MKSVQAWNETRSKYNLEYFLKSVISFYDIKNIITNILQIYYIPIWAPPVSYFKKK